MRLSERRHSCPPASALILKADKNVRAPSPFSLILLLILCSLLAQTAGAATFNVKDYGASGRKMEDARPAIQKAIDVCAAAGGGTVYLPPGEYTSGTLHLSNYVRFEIEAGATLFASTNPAAYDFGNIPSKAALFFGEKIENVTITGRGTVDGQAEYEWREDDVERGFQHRIEMVRLGKSLMRSFPKGFPKREMFPHLVWLGRAKDVQIADLNFLHSPSWSIAMYGCERVNFERLYVYTSLKEGVWADGIDLDGCKDVRITNCKIETGDDCIVFISENSWGPPLLCENVVVSDCRLSSASAGVKFSEGIRRAVRNIVVTNTVFHGVNRGIVFCPALGGEISDVMFSKLTIDCRRYDWFWAGDGQPFHIRVARISELDKVPPKPDEPAPGAVRNILFKDIVAHARGGSMIQGHAENFLNGISFENVKLYVSADPAAAFDLTTNALNFRWVKNLKVKDMQVVWEKPELQAWKSALKILDAENVLLDGLSAKQAWADEKTPAFLLQQVNGVTLRRSRALEGTILFCDIQGDGNNDIRLEANDWTRAKVPYSCGKEVKAGVVKATQNLLP